MSNDNFIVSNNLEKNSQTKSGSLYLFIIWEKSREKTDTIFNDMKEKYVIRDVYEVTWNKTQFTNNFTRFYGTPTAAQQKVDFLGTGPFLLVLVSDYHEKFITLKTDKDTEIINKNILDSKTLYRKWIGMDYAIHSSVSEKESNHNLTLFFGKNAEDFEKQLPEKWNSVIKKSKLELTGHDGWKNMLQLFYVLNGMRYVILRNFENLPSVINQKDIDILTEQPTIRLIINPNFLKTQDRRSALTVNIKNQKVLFDFKFVMDSYFDKKWSEHIIKRRILHSNGFYVPCKEDQFYTLLYHVIFQKPSSFDKYKKNLLSLSKELMITNVDEKTINDFNYLKNYLKTYMHKMKYRNTTSSKYKFLHNTLFRYFCTSILILKTKGLKYLISVIKLKITQ
jgi:hypothetical protein